MEANLKAKRAEQRVAKQRSELAAMNRLAAIAEPYWKANPEMTVGEVLEAEAAKVAAAAGPRTPPEWQDGSIMLRLADARGQVESTARTLGPLAVHRGRKNKSLFSLSHRPTGCALMSSYNERVLMDVAERIVHLDWAFDRLDGCPPATTAAAWVVIEDARLRAA